MWPTRRSVFVPNRGPKGANPLGIASFLFGLLAALVCWIPVLNLFVIPLSAIGLLLGVLGILVGWLSRGVLAYALVGVGLCVGSYAMASRVNDAFVEAMGGSGREARAIRLQETIDAERAWSERRKRRKEQLSKQVDDYIKANPSPAIPPPPAPAAP